MRTNASSRATGFKISAISVALMYCNGTMTLLNPAPGDDTKLGTVERILAEALMKNRSFGPRIISTLLLRSNDSRIGSSWSRGIGERVRNVISPGTWFSMT